MLVANDVDNHVIDPWSPLVDRRARRAKSDRIDAEGMLRALMAYARGKRRGVGRGPLVQTAARWLASPW